VLARASRGATLNVDEIVVLLGLRGGPLREAMEIAADWRDRGLAEAGRPGVVSYSPKVFIPLTRLCRDRCGYCTFATDPADLRSRGEGYFRTLDEVAEIARNGARLGCAEALFTLGDRPESRWEAAREWLAEAGYDSTLGYLRAAAIRVLEETGLLPHLNPGVMTWAELQRLRPVAPSMGLMLETTSERIFRTPGAAHYGSPDKDPTVRLRVLTDAGRANIPFTSGLLVGIGETEVELAESMLALRAVSREYRHVQEVIIQNFRAKSGTAMRARNDLDHETYLAAITTARLVFGPAMRIQAPPNLSEPDELPDLLAAGVDDFGGVSPLTVDHVNPERPWPQVQVLADVCTGAGLRLRPRLAVQPEFVIGDRERWIDPRLHPHLAALTDADGLLAPGVRPSGIDWQEPDDYQDFAASARTGRTELASTIDSEGRRSQRREDFAAVYGDWQVLAAKAESQREAPDPDTASKPGWQHAGAMLDPDVAAALRLAERDPALLAAPEHASAAMALATAEGGSLAAVANLADELRRDAVGEVVTYVVNRNINFTNVCYTGCRFCAFAQRESDPDAFTLPLAEVGRRVDEALAAGATEICMQGGIHPKLPGSAYFDLVAEVKRRRVHLHAFSPMEVVNGATRAGMSIREWLVEAKSAGLDSIPGTAAEILDDDLRWILTKGKLPTETWLEVIGTAHDVGLPSSATMMYGHVDAPAHWVTHLRTLRRQQEKSGGFTEFVGLPFVHHNAPIYLAGIARPGPTRRDDIAVTALARIMLHGAIDNVQVSWVKIGPEACAELLAVGANDLGGTLMEETISRMAGSEHGSAMTAAELRAIARAAGRPARERTTTYGEPLHGSP
jgi:FO synthase